MQEAAACGWFDIVNEGTALEMVVVVTMQLCLAKHKSLMQGASLNKIHLNTGGNLQQIIQRQHGLCSFSGVVESDAALMTEICRQTTC